MEDDQICGVTFYAGFDAGECTRLPMFSVLLHLENSNGTDHEASVDVCAHHSWAVLAWLAAQPREWGTTLVEVRQLHHATYVGPDGADLRASGAQLEPAWSRVYGVYGPGYQLALNGARCPACQSGLLAACVPAGYWCRSCGEAFTEPRWVGRDEASAVPS